MRILLTSALLLILVACEDDNSKPSEPVITFEKAIGTAESEYASEVHQTSDGGYIIVGTQGPIFKIYVVKTDKYGNVEWEKTLAGGPNYSAYGASIQETSYGDYMVAGTTNISSSTEYETLLVILDNQGEEKKSQIFAKTSITSLRRIQGDGFIALCYVYDTSGTSSPFLFRLTSELDTVWTRPLTAPPVTNRAIELATDFGYVITGNTVAGIHLTKVDSNGNNQWAKTYNSSLSDESFAVIPSLDGGYVIAGGLYPVENVGEQLFTIKTTSSGDTFWTRTFGGDLFDRARSVAEATDGGYVFTGQTESFGNGRQAWLLKLDSNGKLVWSRYYGGPQQENGYNIEATSDGGFIIAGSTFSFGAGQEDVYLIKTDSLGLVYP